MYSNKYNEHRILLLIGNLHCIIYGYGTLSVLVMDVLSAMLTNGKGKYTCFPNNYHQSKQ